MASEKEKKKSLTTAEKKELKKQKDEAEEKYATCLLDGRKEKVGNFRVEPPGLFRGRGEHPKKGALKVRLMFLLIFKSYFEHDTASTVCAPKTSH
jgi:DNA topoisomerase I